MQASKIQIQCEVCCEALADAHLDASCGCISARLCGITRCANSDCYKNRCIVCLVDLGDCNPRQLCGKRYCSSQCDGADCVWNKSNCQ